MEAIIKLLVFISPFALVRYVSITGNELAKGGGEKCMAGKRGTGKCRKSHVWKAKRCTYKSNTGIARHQEPVPSTSIVSPLLAN